MVQELYCDYKLVGLVRDSFSCDGTWYGNCNLVMDRTGAFENRVLDFIGFSKDWNERVRSGQVNPPAVSEFRKYEDVIDHKLWFVKLHDETCLKIQKAPAFFTNGDITWLT